MKPCIIVLVSLFHLTQAYTQKYYNNWYFGHNAGVSFNTGAPTAMAGGQMNTQEGNASISDTSGNLLFYTDGVKVWDRNHAVMPNGTGLTGHSSSTQSALIVPVPGSSSKYYIFTASEQMETGDVNYSIVDMTRNNGNGDIDPGNKNINVADNQTEKLVAANSTVCGVWVISHEKGSNQFEARLITANGVGPLVASHTGSVHSMPIPPANINNVTGVMKVSRNSRKLALATLGRIVELFDFDPATGIISNPISLPISVPAMGYGVCFSPDNSKLYVNESVTGGYSIYQYDISSNVAATIIASKTLLAFVSTSVYIVGDMAIGPDGKIYCARPGFYFLPVIPNPNLPAPLCGFNLAGASLLGASATGLPNEIRVPVDHIMLELGPDTTLCPGEMLSLHVPGASSYLWSNGATTPSINVTTAGQYWVHVTKGSCSFSDSIHVAFNTPVVNLGNDTAICQGQLVTLNAQTAGTGNTYLWSTGATTEFINVTTGGAYSVVVSRGNCSDTSTINVAVKPLPVIHLGNDTTLCEGKQVLLSAGVADDYLWSTGETSAAITASVSGQYWVKASLGNCTNADTIVVNMKPLPRIPFRADTSVCRQELLTLDAGVGDRYLWSTGETTRTIAVTTSGPVWAKVNYYGSCDKTYTIDVSFKSCDCEMYVPTAFTPNNDLLNDLLRPLPASDCEFISFTVFNRYGQKVFESRDVTKGWDGKLNGTMQPTGVFVWEITARKSGQKVLMKGTTALIR